MNFNDHRRNKSFAVQPQYKERKEGRSLKKVQHLTLAETIFIEAKNIYQAQGDLSQAIKLFHQYLALNPYSSQALYLCAVCELKLGQTENALAHLITVSDQYQNKANAMLLTAMALNKLGRITQSLEIVNECIRRFEGFEEAVCFRGKLYLAMKYFHKSQQDFKSLVSKPNASFLPHHSLGDCYRAQGKPQKAIGPYLEALQLLGLQEGTEGLKNQIQLKIGICLYQLQKWQESYQYLWNLSKSCEKWCELYYYLGCCQLKLHKRQEGILHLQYCLRVQGNIPLMHKAFKKLLEEYLTNFQFYEAINVVKLGQIAGVQLEGWGDAVEAFIFIIKGNYDKGIEILTKLCSIVRKSEESKKLMKFKRETSHPKQRYNDTSQIRNGLLLTSPGGKAKQKMAKGKQQKQAKLRYFSTKSVAKAVPKIESTRVRTKIVTSSINDLRIKTEHIQKEQQKELYLSREKQFMYPLILLFKAYGQFFQNQFFLCLDTYEEYQTYIKDVFGRESDILYNKYLCEGLLMADNDMQDDALSKFSSCIDLYFQKHDTIPAEPILYKISLLIKLAVQKQKQTIEEEEDSKQELLEAALLIMDNYKSAIGSNALAIYFRALICLLLGKLSECSEELEKSLKVAEDCSWRWLWVKGVIETKLGNYYQAVKQFSAGLILQSNPELYLGRSIAFFLLSEEKKIVQDNSLKGLMSSAKVRQESNSKKSPKKDKKCKKQIMVENCFEDLQKYIELETKQEEISLWVSKLLFASGAYDEAIRSLRKISDQTPQVIQMIEAVSIYEGEFSDGGKSGSIIQSAFEGKYISSQQEQMINSNKAKKKLRDFQFQDADYEMWLIILHLYIRENYPLLLKYIQRELFSCQESPTQLLLRYNVSIIYLLLEEQGKAINALRALVGKEDNFHLGPTLAKMEQIDFDNDECLQDVREELGISCSKLLSNYLPYRSITLSNSSKSVRLYVRPCIPFPNFRRPSLLLSITNQQILQEVSAKAIEKKLEAPWIKRTQKRTVQFTQNLQQSGLEICGETGSLKETKGLEKEEFMFE